MTDITVKINGVKYRPSRGFDSQLNSYESGLKHGDPALGAFLDFVEADIKAHPERLRVFDGALYDRLKALVGDVGIDLDEPLSPDDE